MTEKEKLINFIQNADVDSDKLKAILVDEVFGDTFRDYIVDVIQDWDNDTCSYTITNIEHLLFNKETE
jgi:hypothetical protein